MQERLGGKCTETYGQPRKNTRIPFALSVPYCRYRKQNIETAKRLLAQETETQKEEALEDGRQVWEKQDIVWNEIKLLIKNFRHHNCPKCKKGRLRFAGLVKDVPWEPG